MNNKLIAWYGKIVADMTREELIEALNQCYEQMEQEQKYQQNHNGKLHDLLRLKRIRNSMDGL